MSAPLIVDGLPYPVVIADDASRVLPSLIGDACRTAVIMFDRAVEARARTLADALSASHIAVRANIPVTVDAQTKRLASMPALYEALLDAGADRRTWLIAVGGGTLTDAAGFAAATFVRGIPWAAVPTTVLGMADAALGGKTGVDTERGKNLVGAFWDPQAVVGDIAALQTLPPAQRMTGLAEIVKCAIVGDPALLDAVAGLHGRATDERWKSAIGAAARVKARIVARDPRESGERAQLNLGHTVGHGIEVASGYSLTHGNAVSLGLRAEGLMAQTRGWWPRADHARMLGVLSGAGLPVAAPSLTAEAVIAAMTHDKKSVDGMLRFALPVRIGEVRHGIAVDGASVLSAVRSTLHEPPADEWTR